MTESITSKGRNTKEAVELALSLLGRELSEVEIEIIENEEKGFLGFKSKPAIVRVKVKESSQSIQDFISNIDTNQTVVLQQFQESQSIEQVSTIVEDNQQVLLSNKSNNNFNQDDLGGKSWVLDGKVFCKDTPNKYPIIEPTNGVQLFKNGILINSKVIISETDVIKTELINEETPPVWDIKINSDQLEAYLIIKVGKKITHILKDQAPSSLTKLEVEEVCTPIHLDSKDVFEKLKDLNIIHGLDYDAIHLACTSGEDGTFLIAKGTPPTKGKNGYFHLYGDYGVKHQLKERANGSVDFRETREFPSVDFGQIIGEIMPPREGIPGKTVTGVSIPPEEVYPVILKAGTGVIIVADSKVVSAESGFPEVKVNGQLATVSVIPKLIIHNDVTIETGNIHYLGAVEINASIQDSMTVEAQGNILVKGNVYRANVLSAKSIIINKNIIASRITSGNRNLIKLKLSDSLLQLSNQLTLMNAAIKQLSQASAFKVNSLKVTGLGPLIKILCNSKFKELLPLMNDIVMNIHTHSSELEREWIEFAEVIHREFINIHVSSLKSEEDLINIIKLTDSLHLSVKTENENECHFIRADFVQNSYLDSSGDIVILGQGVYSSNLFARKNIIINGFVRGGEIYAEDSVMINEVVNRVGSSVKIAVSKNGTIKIKRASENTTIQVGGKSQTLFNSAKNIIASLDNQGNLNISKEK